MEQLLVVAMPGAWPAWDLAPLAVRSSVVLAGPDRLDDVDCVAIVPESRGQLQAAVRTVAVREDPVALVLAARPDLPGVDELLVEHDFDGFIDLAWPSPLVRAAVRLAIRHVQLGRNVVAVQRAVLAHTRDEAASLYRLAAEKFGHFDSAHVLGERESLLLSVSQSGPGRLPDGCILLLLLLVQASCTWTAG